MISELAKSDTTHTSAANRNVCSVGLMGDELVNWGGGCDLLRLIAAGLASPEYHVSLLLPQLTLSSRIRSELGAWRRMISNVVRLEHPRHTKTKPLDTGQIAASIESSGCAIKTQSYIRTSAGLARTVREQEIRVVLPCFYSPGRKFLHPWVGYIPDLQHKALPDFFSASERSNRDRRYQQLLREARALVVASQSVKDDLIRHYDAAGCHIVVLPFAPIPNPEWLVGESLGVREKYALPDRYFLISNQFWQHKDHATAFKALAMLSSDVHLICTGSTQDYRAPQYFASLETLVDSLQIKHRVRFLGHIPKSEQMAIMRDAVAVLQPTLFEGGPGGGSVYDAVGIGAPAIVSDIAVNQEISGEDVDFFRVGSTTQLAEKMLRALESKRSRPGAQVLLERANASRERLRNALKRAIDVATDSDLADDAR